MSTLILRAAVQQRLGVSQRTLIYWAERGYGPTPYRVGRHVKYYEHEVAEFVEAQRIEPSEAPALVA